MDVKKKIEELLNEILSAEYFIVDILFVNKKPNSKLTILLDGDKGISVDTCAEVSRILAEKLDEADLIAGAYTLEISSPGIDKSLTMKRQYAKNIGRKLKILLYDGSQQTGTLQVVEEETISIRKELKNKQKEANQSVLIAFRDIKQANVLVSFH